LGPVVITLLFDEFVDGVHKSVGAMPSSVAQSGAVNGWEEDMNNRALLRTLIIGGGLLVSGVAFAQSTPRSVCCKEMGGRWEENRYTKEMRCYGVATNPYYACVAKRTGR
jgi:hypothetical protein